MRLWHFTAPTWDAAGFAGQGAAYLRQIAAREPGGGAAAWVRVNLVFSTHPGDNPRPVQRARLGNGEFAFYLAKDAATLRHALSAVPLAWTIVASRPDEGLALRRFEYTSSEAAALPAKLARTPIAAQRARGVPISVRDAANYVIMHSILDRGAALMVGPAANLGDEVRLQGWGEVQTLARM